MVLRTFTAFWVINLPFKEETMLNTSGNIGRDKSFVDDLIMERGIVRVRVASVPRFTEIQPCFLRFAF